MGASELSHTTESLCMMAGLLALLLLSEKDRSPGPWPLGPASAPGYWCDPCPASSSCPVVAAWVWFGLDAPAPRNAGCSTFSRGRRPSRSRRRPCSWSTPSRRGTRSRAGIRSSTAAVWSLFQLDNAVMSVSLPARFSGRTSGCSAGRSRWSSDRPSRERLADMSLALGLRRRHPPYRIITPKTVVATLGPVLPTRNRPAARAGHRQRHQAVRGLAGQAEPRRREKNGLRLSRRLDPNGRPLFPPFVIMNIHRSSESRQRVFRLIEEKTNGKILGLRQLHSSTSKRLTTGPTIRRTLRPTSTIRSSLSD